MTFETAMEKLGTLQRFGSPAQWNVSLGFLRTIRESATSIALIPWQVQTEKVPPALCYLLFAGSGLSNRFICGSLYYRIPETYPC